MDAYEREKEQLKKELGIVGHKDLDIVKLKNELIQLYKEISNSYVEKQYPTLDKIYIVGSFATNTAIKTVSDIDIRYVSQNKITDDEQEWLSEYVKYNGKDTVSTQDYKFGYIDANIFSMQPPEPYIKIS